MKGRGEVKGRRGMKGRASEEREKGRIEGIIQYVNVKLQFWVKQRSRHKHNW